jgi:hypothetical protein
MTAPRPDTLAFATALDGQYRLEREIGRGGMGIVYLARDLKLDRPVAIKTLPYHLASDPVIRERFLREARTAAALTHPSIVPIHRADELGDFVFFVMGFVDGESVAQRVRRAGPFAPAELLPLLIEVASALGYAHARGVVHRDVKAENILLDATGSRAMVTDFGIARLAQSASLTQTGTVLGTVFYMSPEQVSGADVDGRSDLYSLGVLAFFALTGRFPFESETPSAVLVAHVTRQPPPIRSIAPTVPEPLAAIVDRLLLKDRALRYAEAGEVVGALAAAAREIPLDAPAASQRPGVAHGGARHLGTRGAAAGDDGPAHATTGAHVAGVTSRTGERNVRVQGGRGAHGGARRRHRRQVRGACPRGAWRGERRHPGRRARGGVDADQGEPAGRRAHQAGVRGHRRRRVERPGPRGRGRRDPPQRGRRGECEQRSGAA